MVGLDYYLLQPSKIEKQQNKIKKKHSTVCVFFLFSICVSCSKKKKKKMSRRPTTVTAQKLQLEYLRTRIEDVAYFSLCLLSHVLQVSGPPVPRKLDVLRQWVRANQITTCVTFQTFQKHFSVTHPSFVAEVRMASETLSACSGVLLTETPRDPVGNLWLFLLRFVDERPHFFQNNEYEPALLPEVRDHMSKFLFVLNQPVGPANSSPPPPVAEVDPKLAVTSEYVGPGCPGQSGWGDSSDFRSTVGAIRTE